MVVEECLKWCAQRYVFGKPLLAQAVIRNKCGFSCPASDSRSPSDLLT